LSAKSVIETCKKNFSRHGIPDVVVTDGGTNFVNQDFKSFSKEWIFTHLTSSPHYPQGNGKAESTVKIAKK
jgi:transposase InsO family protein